MEAKAEKCAADARKAESENKNGLEAAAKALEKA